MLDAMLSISNVTVLAIGFASLVRCVNRKKRMALKVGGKLSERLGGMVRQNTRPGRKQKIHPAAVVPTDAAAVSVVPTDAVAVSVVPTDAVAVSVGEQSSNSVVAVGPTGDEKKTLEAKSNEVQSTVI